MLVFDEIYGSNQLVERWRYNDDGVEVQERFEFGQLVEFTQFDAQNAHNWEFQHIMYDPNGDMMRRETFFDNGISKTEEFFEGRLFYTVEYDDSEWSNGSNQHDWELIHTEYDELGRMLGRYVSFDDGGYKQEYYMDGVLDWVEEHDGTMPDVEDPMQFGSHDWQVRYFDYDANGQLEFRFIQYDDGSTHEDIYFDGNLVESRRTDTSYEFEGRLGAYDWEWVVTYYEQNGEIAGEFYQYDNGTVRDDFYYQGVLTHTTYSDNYGNPEISWSFVDIFYDEQGQMTERYVEYDDGTRKLDQYVDGVLRRSDTHDDLYANATPWSQQVFIFDEDGDMEARGNHFDN